MAGRRGDHNQRIVLRQGQGDTMEDLLGKRTFTNREKAMAIEREIKQRKYVYPRRVAP